MIPAVLLIGWAVAALPTAAALHRDEAPESIPEARSRPASLPDDVARERRGQRETERPPQAAPLAKLETVRDELVRQVNQRRLEAGRAGVYRNGILDAAAQRHAEEMLRHGYYDHRGLDGRNSFQRVVAARYVPRFVAENIARGLFSPREAFERWMASSGHRRNILDDEAREIGLGVAAGEGARGFDTLWVMVLARPRDGN